MSVEYLDLADYIAIASELTGIDATVIASLDRISLADSALHAPSAEFNGNSAPLPGQLDEPA